MSAFYEWKKEGNRKVPYRIFLPDEDIFFVPALFHKDNNNEIHSSLITTTPNKFIKPIHHRMPVIIKIKEGINYLIDDSETNLTRCIPYSGKMNMETVVI
jgi:putative SOS response-associated peptidase YedK